MRVLVLGGAGYIGSVVARFVLEAGHRVTVLDDLSTGHRDAVPDGVDFVQGDISTAGELFADGDYDAVIHLAAKSLVGESVVNPSLYWHTNVEGSRALLDAMTKHEVPRLVFSSTAATYGEPDEVPITEDFPTKPTNTYGATKLAVDMMITGECIATDLAAVSLRYFNVPAPRTARASGTAPRRTSSPSRWKRCSASATSSPSTATTGPPPTAPPCATTCTSPTWPARMCSR